MFPSLMVSRQQLGAGDYKPTRSVSWAFLFCTFCTKQMPSFYYCTTAHSCIMCVYERYKMVYWQNWRGYQQGIRRKKQHNHDTIIQSCSISPRATKTWSQIYLHTPRQSSVRVMRGLKVRAYMKNYHALTVVSFNHRQDLKNQNTFAGWLGYPQLGAKVA